MFSCFTVSNYEITEGIGFQDYKYVRKDSSESVCSLAQLALFPLYPDKTQSIQAQTALPLSVAYIQSVKSGTADKQGIVLAVKPDQWIPANSSDKSLLLDFSKQFVLLYCPVGTTLLKSCSDDLKLLQVDKDCKPVISDTDSASLSFSSLEGTYITPQMNSSAPQILESKLRKTPRAKRPASDPISSRLKQVKS